VQVEMLFIGLCAEFRGKEKSKIIIIIIPCLCEKEVRFHFVATTNLYVYNNNDDDDNNNKKHICIAPQARNFIEALGPDSVLLRQGIRQKALEKRNVFILDLNKVAVIKIFKIKLKGLSVHSTSLLLCFRFGFADHCARL